eukprot:TRINITY_DN4798_c0_g1_i1.p1 TRINITY_DN4798_c0_g1~~TRINITY_DN4798_c0_g1_i1.p1  ORF type:complete len:1142 (+),score=403.61 TRINITY_DN4798_c0_g1_i1:166-3591(+)
MAESTPSSSSSSSSGAAAATGPKMDAALFVKRMNALLSHWRGNKLAALWKDADSLLVVMGSGEDDNPYRKTNVIQTWFLGYEFADTVLLVTEKTIYFLSSPRKVQLLQPIATAWNAEGKSELVLLTSEKSGNASHFERMIGSMKESHKGKNVGVILKDETPGAFAKQWTDALSKEVGTEGSITKVDVPAAWSEVLSVKDDTEQRNIRNSSTLSVQILSKHLVSKIEAVVDEGKSVTHVALSEEMEALFQNPEKLNARLSKDAVDSSYPPLIQSGGVYDLRLSAENTNEPLHFGTIVCSLGSRYKGYCSNIARTLFIDPPEEVGAAYKVLLEVHGAVVKALHGGEHTTAAMARAQEILDKHPELKEKFTKSCGYGIGLEFQEGYLLLNQRNDVVIRPGMVFSVVVGFHNLQLKKPHKDQKRNTYSMLLSDTVLIKEDGEAEVLTAKAEKKYSEVAYFLEAEEQKEKKAESTKPAKATNGAAAKPDAKGKGKSETVIVNSRTRGESSDKAGSSVSNAEDDRKYRQEMEARHLEEAERRLAKAKGKVTETDPKASQFSDNSKIVAYRDPNDFPSEIKRNKIFVDMQREVVVLPVYGYMVPFHITTIKNASKNEDCLRINFATPSLTQAQSDSPDRVYVRELTYRIQDQHSLNNSLRLIKELRKRATQRESEAKETENLVEQEKLILSKDRRNPRLNDVFIRPTISGGAGSRRSTGSLEAHSNGFRFSTNKGNPVDIMYKNIKHAFFQPAEGELVVIVHFHLKNGILIGKKKITDVQFCAEVMEGSQGLDGRGSMMDRDEIEEEQREAEHRRQLNEEFRQFVKKVEDMDAFQNGPKEFDIPYRELGFNGVPGRTNVFLQPTVNCLVSLVEAPFFVLTLDEIEVVHLERVAFGLRNFDIAFVFKDHKKQVSHVNTVPMENLDDIKDWLKESKILFYDGPTNLNWNRIMQTVREDEEGFIKLGGWAFLSPESDSEDDGADSEDGSDFAEGGSDSEGSEPDEEYDEDEYSEGGSGSDDDDEDSYDEESEEEGLDWDELESRARKEDSERGHYSDDERPTGKSKSKRSREYSDDEDSDTASKKKKAAPASSSSSKGAPSKSSSSSSSKPSSSSAKPSSSSAKPSSSSSAKPSSSSAKPASKPVAKPKPN